MNIIHCIVPTFNRLNCIRSIIGQLLNQCNVDVRIIVINDGSTDGTSEYLSNINDARVEILTGDGSMWWGGATAAGQKHVINSASTDDYMLLINDDTVINEYFLFDMVNASKNNGSSVIGATQKSLEEDKIISYGYYIDYKNFLFINIETANENIISVDALPGRGVLFPMIVVNSIGVVDYKNFPHYLGDLEYSSRAKKKGYKLLVLKNIYVKTSAISSDRKVSSRGRLARLSNNRSKDFLLIRIKFFSILNKTRFMATLVSYIKKKLNYEA